jgi:hypothetical protein
LRKYDLPPLPGEEPKRVKSDPALFDLFNVTKRQRLFDSDLPANLEERIERKPYTLARRKRCLRPFLSPTGEVVHRLRGGKGFTPIYAPWSREGLVRRGVIATARPTENGGRVLEWSKYPLGYAGAEPELPPPHVVRRAVDLALAGADIGGFNIPGVKDLADRTLGANRLGHLELGLGPRIDEASDNERLLPFISLTGELVYRAVPVPADVPLVRMRQEGATELRLDGRPTDQRSSANVARARYRAELEERKRFGRERVWVPGMPMHVNQGRRAKTSEYRNDAGEYGPETKLTRDGRVLFGRHSQPQINGTVESDEGKAVFGCGVAYRELHTPPIGTKTHTQRRKIKLASGRTVRVDAQKAVERVNKPGPKPKYGVTMNNRLRKIKQRCAQRAVPFVIAEHMKPRKIA